MIHRKCAKNAIATKFHAIAQSITENQLKTVIMIHNRSPGNKTDKDEQMRVIAKSNPSENIRGELHQVIVPYEAFNIGISLYNVRRFIFADLSVGLQIPTLRTSRQSTTFEN